MFRIAAVAAALIVVACAPTEPVPSAAPSFPPVVTPVPVDLTSSPSVSPSAAARSSQSSAASVITEQVGLLSVTHPVAWRLVAGPEEIPGRPVPLFYLSNAPLTVGACPTPDPKSGEFQGCPEPLAALPPGGVLVTVNPNLGIVAMNPPQITFKAKTEACHAIGGEGEMWSVVGGTVLNACLRGPDLAAHEAEVRSVISSLRQAA
jgi:hypothetical protein